MISMKLDFFEFVDSVKCRDKHIILSLAETEAKEAEKISEMMGIGDDYISAILELIYFLRYSQKPGGVKDEYLHLYRAICENLIAKKQLSPDVLEMLEPQEKYSRVIGRI